MNNNPFPLNSELPIGFAMELATDMNALDAFAKMDQQHQRECIDTARRMNTRDDMHDYVRDIGTK